MSYKQRENELKKYIYFFTKDQVDVFLEMLKQYAPPIKILQFVGGLDFYCYIYRNEGEKITRPYWAKNKKHNEVLLRDARELLKQIERYEAGKEKFIFPDTIGELPFMDDRYVFPAGRNPIQFYNREVKYYAEKAATPLKEFIDTFELLDKILYAPETTKKRSADSAGFIKIAAMFYGRYIGEPTMYASNQQTGDFFSTVQYILECLKLPHANPSRSIKKVLKTFKRSRGDILNTSKNLSDKTITK